MRQRQQKQHDQTAAENAEARKNDGDYACGGNRGKGLTLGKHERCISPLKLPWNWLEGRAARSLDCLEETAAVVEESGDEEGGGNGGRCGGNPLRQVQAV